MSENATGTVGLGFNSARELIRILLVIGRLHAEELWFLAGVEFLGWLTVHGVDDGGRTISGVKRMAGELGISIWKRNKVFQRNISPFSFSSFVIRSHQFVCKIFATKIKL